MERRKKVRDSKGVETEGIVVGVVESTERWSDVLLEDGTRFKRQSKYCGGDPC